MRSADDIYDDNHYHSEKERNYSMKKRILAVAAAMSVAVVMMFGGTVSAFADEAKTADIDVSLQTGDTFLVQHKTIKVSSTLSEEYGYTDEIPADKGVSAIDALIAMHIDHYNTTDKTVINEKLTTNASGAVKMLGEGEGKYSGFAVNSKYAFQEGSTTTGATIFQAALKSGDSVDFFWYEDSMWMDTITLFSDSGKKVDSLKVKAGEEFTVSVEGFMYMMGYANPDNEPVENAVICNVDASGQAVPLSDADGNRILTDKDGKAVLSLSEGTYNLTVLNGDKEMGSRIIMPWCTVTVTGDEDPVIDPSEDSSEDPSQDPSEEPSSDQNEHKGTEASTDKKSDTAKTGDDSHIMMFVLIAAAAAVCGGVTVFARRKAH